MFLKTVVKYLNKVRFNIVFGFMAIFDYMNMYRFMVIRVKLEDKSENNENRWHGLSCSIASKVSKNLGKSYILMGK